MRAIVERWFLTEPVLFATMMTHRLVFCEGTSIRIGRGRVELSPAFVDALEDRDLERVLVAEASRILLKHPYERRMPARELAYRASNITLKEHLRTPLPFPSAADAFGTHDLDRQYFELYYDELARSGGARTDRGSGVAPAGVPQTGVFHPSDGPLERHASGDATSAALWERDTLLTTRLDDVIRDAIASDAWGSLPGSMRERVMAALAPDVDYRDVLRGFRARVLASSLRLTRMTPSRRYEPLPPFLHPMGRRPEFTTRLLFALDVSGSMSSADLANALGAVGRFFRYGVRTIDLLRFDTELQGPVVALRRGVGAIEVTGRGGTSFDPVMTFLDQHADVYDGAIVFTDGIAARPEPPARCRTPIVWLFSTRDAWDKMHRNIDHTGRSAFIRTA